MLLEFFKRSILPFLESVESSIRIIPVGGSSIGLIRRDPIRLMGVMFHLGAFPTEICLGSRRARYGKVKEHCDSTEIFLHSSHFLGGKIGDTKPFTCYTFCI